MFTYKNYFEKFQAFHRPIKSIRETLKGAILFREILLSFGDRRKTLGKVIEGEP